MEAGLGRNVKTVMYPLVNSPNRLIFQTLCIERDHNHMLYEQALCTLENVGNKIALSFRDDFPEINQLPFVDLKPSILPLSSSVLEVGKTSRSTESIVQVIQETYQNKHWRQPKDKGVNPIL